MSRKPEGPLRRGWTTGACAAAAAKAAYQRLMTGTFPDPVSIRLPRGEEPAFPLAEEGCDDEGAFAGIIKDAGDDPDVTHGALIRSHIRLLPAGSGLRFAAGEGVGTVTRPGLPLAPGEPAINPKPREIIRAALESVAGGAALDLQVTVSIPGGEEMAERTLNGRLGIVGGLSVLGTTGIVVPFSCAAWIDSIHRGIDVARAMGVSHVAGSTGRTSEQAVRQRHHLAETQLLEMGDFAGGLLKYIARHPIPRLTIAGGIGKLAKLAQGQLDLHSGRSRIDIQAMGRADGRSGPLRGGPGRGRRGIRRGRAPGDRRPRGHPAGPPGRRTVTAEGAGKSRDRLSGSMWRSTTVRAISSPRRPAMISVLILGGTGDARNLARKLSEERDIRVVSSLAGVLAQPPDLPGEVRIGGFGGADGLTDYLRTERIDLLVDATHPFAAGISMNASEAATNAGVPMARLNRPSWKQQPGDRWIEVPDVTAAVRACAGFKRPFLTLGRKDLASFSGLETRCLVRMVELPRGGIPLPDYDLELARGPFSESDEQALMQRYETDVLVTKASGGDATYGKIAAARALGLPVVMIARPRLPDALELPSPDAMAAWIRSRFSL